MFPPPNGGGFRLQQSGGPRPPSDDAIPDLPTAPGTEAAEINEIENELRYFGDLMEAKPTSVFRGISVQLSGLPTDPYAPKHEALISAILDHDADVVAIQEVNINFNRVGPEGQWKQRIGWNNWLNGQHCKTINAWNSKDHINQVHQHGGTALLARGTTSFYAAGAGIDPTKLGRWCWTRYRGRSGTHLRIVSFYRPCKGGRGERTVSSVQRRCLQDSDDSRDPRKAFLEDFRVALDEWISMGDALVVCGDINQDVLSPEITNYFDDIGLRHLIFSKHDPTDAPPTYYHRTSPVAVDGIWASPCLTLLRGGYLPKYSFPGDHLPIWFDISYNQAFGHNLPKTWKPQARRLQLRDSRCVRRYNKILTKLLLQHHLPQRQYVLEATTHQQALITGYYYLSVAQQHEAHAIDIQTAKCMIEAEDKCRKLKMGGVLFSAETMLPRFQVAFWQLAIKRRKGQAISTRQWTRFKEKAQIAMSMTNTTLEMMQESLKTAYSAYREVRKNHESNRLKFIETFAPKDRDRLLRTEEARRKGRICKIVSGKLQGQGGVISVIRSDIVDGQEVLTECLTPAHMNDTLIAVNAAKYQQCNNSAFLNEPLLTEFGYLSDTPQANAVLDGTYIPPPGTDPYAVLLLQHMRRPPGMPSQPQSSSFVSTTNHISSWKKAKEYTSSGISGLHFGMFKAQATDPDLASYDASRRSLMYSTGSSYPRWNKGADVMLLKASKDTRAHKLRTVLLLEADYNMNCKLLGREAMWSAEKFGCLAREQAGGRRGHSSSESFLNLALINDDSRFKRKAMAICSNDAKGCFDRIVHSVAIICLRRFGLPQAPLTSMFTVIQQLDHHIRTAFGDSDESYGPSSHAGAHPNQGTLQGNGASGTSWSAVSSSIIEAMRSQGFGYSSWSAISKAVIKLVCSAFVDDTDLIHSGPSNLTTGAEVAAGLQNVLDTWDGLLRATGGALEQQKSYWYLIDYERRKNKWAYKANSATPFELLLYNDDTQQREPIPRLSPHKAKKALGILGRPDGLMHDETKHLRQKTRDWADSLRTKRLKKNDAWYCANATIMRTIQYPLVATTLTTKQCSHIMAPFFYAILPTIRVQKNLPRVLLYAPIKYQGRGIEDPHSIQLILHLQCILKHCTRSNPTGDLLNSNMENLVLELGSSLPFWDLDFETWKPLATPSWITSTWGDLRTTDLQLKGPLPRLQLQREHDLCLMDKFTTLGLTPEELASLNDVRMFKKVIRLSDITSADGCTLLPQSLTNAPPSHTSPLEWPRCYRPSANQITFWKNTIRSCFTPPHATHLRLTQPLGPWFHDSDQPWDWWYSESMNALYKRSEDLWEIWTRVEVVYRRPHFSPSPHRIPALPHDACRATISGSAHRCTLLNTGPTMPPPPAPMAMTSLQDLVIALDPSERWALEYIDAPNGTDTIAQAIASCQCFAVTDASLKDGCGTAAFTLVGPLPNEDSIRAVNKVPGPLKDGDSYRSELTGIYGILLITRLLCSLHHLTSGAIHVRCDNEASLRVFDPWFIPNPSNNSFDLVNAIWHLLKDSPITWTAEWIEGHQDDLGHALDRFAQLNCDMDKLAEIHRLNIYYPGYRPPQIQIAGEGWTIWCNGEKLHSPHRHILYDRIKAPHILQYWTNTHSLQPVPRIPPAAIALVDWDASESFMKILPLGKQIWCMKNGSENCGVGITLKAWKKQTDDTCPCCGAPEDTTHVLRCTAQDTTEVWHTSITKLKTYLEDHGAPMELQEAIPLRLTQWRSNIPFTDHHDWSPTLLDALHQQDAIGWKNFMEGLPAKQWTTYATRHHQQIRSTRCPHRWFSRVLMAIHDVAWNQWEYRNHYLHEAGRPRYLRAVAILNRQIITEFSRGVEDLPAADHHHFSFSLLHLLHRSTSYKKYWYTNVIAARQCQDRRIAATGQDRAESLSHSKLTHWIRTGRLQ